MAKFVQTVLQIATPDLPQPTSPLQTQPLSTYQNPLLKMPSSHNLNTYLHLPPSREIRITASGLALLILFISIMVLLLIWYLVLTLDFCLRYVTGGLGGKRRRRCGGGHEEEGLCRGERHVHFGGLGVGEKRVGDPMFGRGIASAVESNWEELSSGIGAGDGAGDSGTRRRSVE